MFHICSDYPGKPLPSALQAWFAENPLPFMWEYALWTSLSYIFWHHAVSGTPFLPARKAPTTKRVHYVRRQEYAPPSLSSVKELSEDLE